MANQTAQERYEANKAEIVEKMTRLQAMLDKHVSDFVEDGCKNWGYVGDLANVNDMLSRALNEEELED